MNAEQAKGWAEILTGPFSALLLCMGIIYSMAVYVPTLTARHFDAVDRMMDEHKQDREIYRESMEKMNDSIKELHHKVDRLNY